MSPSSPSPADPIASWPAYSTWSDHSSYETELVVSQAHPGASDNNPGSSEAPLKTIQAAAERATPNTRILIHAGVYRECVRPLQGGLDAANMIRYQAAEGEHVEIRGSRILPAAWTRPRAFEPEYNGPGKALAALSQNTWLMHIDDELLPEGYDALSLPNVTEEEIPLMSWMEPVKEYPPYDLPRVMLFQNGQRLTLLHHAGDVARVPGSFWVDPDERRIMLHPFDQLNPNHQEMEVALQSHLFCPKALGLNYLALQGLHFAHCANGFLRASTGAVTTRGGGYWIIEDCEIREVNSSGLEFGDNPFEYKQEHPERNDKRFRGPGHCIIRRNHIHQCGTAGIRCLHVTEGRVQQNHIHHCCWQEAEYYFECAAIKLLVTRNCLVEDNLIEDIAGGCGIWLDWDNEGSRACRNRISRVKGFQGGIFLEASQVPNLIDHNLIEDIDGPGIFGGDSSRQLYVRNWVGPCSGAGIDLHCHTDRMVRGSQVTCTENQIIHTTFYRCAENVVAEEGNLFQDS